MNKKSTPYPYFDAMASAQIRQKYITIGKIMVLNPTATPEFLEQFSIVELEKFYTRLLSVKPFLENTSISS